VAHDLYFVAQGEDLPEVVVGLLDGNLTASQTAHLTIGPVRTEARIDRQEPRKEGRHCIGRHPGLTQVEADDGAHDLLDPDPARWVLRCAN
jgi:hypothetical protein